MELREQRGVTQAQLADDTGINQSEISRIERGAANPTEKTLRRIVEALDAEIRIVAKATA
jgi:transcriptional regulator with XRE-family HTH domain